MTMSIGKDYPTNDNVWPDRINAPLNSAVLINCKSYTSSWTFNGHSLIYTSNILKFSQYIVIKNLYTSLYGVYVCYGTTKEGAAFFGSSTILENKGE